MIEMYSGLEKIKHMKNMLIEKLNAGAFDYLQTKCNEYSECYGGCHHCIDARRNTHPGVSCSTK